MGERDLVWTDPGWRAGADEWIEARLGELGLTRAGPIEQPHVRAWSTVMRVPTGGGSVWFKANGPQQAYEAGVVRVLAERCPRQVPELLAVDEGRSWMLLADGGTRLRELLDGDPGLVRWETILPLHAELQIAASPARDELLAAGAPHRSLDALMGGLERLLADPEALRPAVDEALTREEIERLERQVPRLADLCTRVGALELPESINHGDLHDGQMLVRDDRYLFFDWGDASVTHPFFATVVPLRVLAYKLGIQQLDEPLNRLRDAYLEPWTAFHSRGDLLGVYDDAYRLGTLSRLLDWRDYVAVSPELALEHDYADAVPVGVRLLLEVLDGKSHVW
jgi:phosphotransferase family enzyme